MYSHFKRTAVHMGQTLSSLVWSYFLVAIVLDQAHLVCPIGLAWNSPLFRDKMLREPDKYILLPLIFVLVPLGIGAGSVTIHDPAFRALATLYLVWNAWHFAMQNYGICAIYGGCSWQRNAAFALTAACILAFPLVLGNVLWVVVAALGVDLMHWIMDIRLSGFVARQQWLFTAIVLVVGVTGFTFRTVSADTHHCGQLLACTMVYSIPTLLGLRYGLGFYHFLMSRWVWSREGRALLA